MKKVKWPIRKKLSNENTQRYGRYAEDFYTGLKILEKYEQGVTIFGSARTPENAKYYQLARELGGALANAGHAVITGGAEGIMGAANRGAFEAGGKSIGLNIKLPEEQLTNPYLTDFAEFRYFFARKVILASSGKTFVFFPGGYGTMDELFEILTLVQTEKIPPTPIVLFGSDFWNDLEKFFVEKSLAQKPGMFDDKDRYLYTITDDIDYVVDLVGRVTARDSKQVIENLHK